jgi:hypothetical protein
MRDAALDEDDRAVGDGERRLHVLLDQHDGNALAVDLLQPGKDFRHDLGRQAGTGLVEDQNSRFDDQRTRHRQHLPLSARQRPGAA